MTVSEPCAPQTRRCWIPVTSTGMTKKGGENGGMPQDKREWKEGNHRTQHKTCHSPRKSLAPVQRQARIAMAEKTSLSRLKLTDFRNYAEASLSLDGRHVVLTGNNGEFFERAIDRLGHQRTNIGQMATFGRTKTYEIETFVQCRFMVAHKIPPSMTAWRNSSATPARGAISGSE